MASGLSDLDLPAFPRRGIPDELADLLVANGQYLNPFMSEAVGHVESAEVILQCQ